MEDLSKEMTPDKPISPKMRALLDKERIEARQRIIDRGIVHFRADKEFMALLLDAADQCKTAPGALCRRIVWEQLKKMRSEPKKAVLTDEGADLPTLAMLSMIEQVSYEQHALREAVEQMQIQLRNSTLPQVPQPGKSQKKSRGK